MKILFLTDLNGNSGSINANRKIILNWPEKNETMILTSVKPAGGLIETLAKARDCDVCCLSGNQMVRDDCIQ